MNLLRSEPQVTPMRQQTLDDLWHEAEKLGRVSVESDWSGTYKATVHFNRKSGTRVYAEGKNTVALFALATAINEAREMGAGNSDA